MRDIPDTRRSLLIELGRQSDEAWAEFLALHEEVIRRLARARGLQDADARDLVQEVLAAVHRRLPSWDLDAGRGSFRAWLLGVVRNVTADALAERARRPLSTADTRIEGALEGLSAPEETEDEFELQYRRAALAAASSRVRDEVRAATWRAFHATAVEGRAPEEVARELGLTVGAVYTAKCRVLARLRERVADLDARTGTIYQPPHGTR